MITGVRPATFTNLQLNAGIFLKDFNYSTYADAKALLAALQEERKTGTNILSATRGGGSFIAQPEVREIEVDGKRYAFKGSTVIDAWDIKLTGTMVEITSDTFKAALATADVQTTGQKKTVTIRTDIKDTDYIKSLCWIGDTSDGFVLIELDNALNLSGANFTFTDKGEGTLPFEFSAHQSSVEDLEGAPCRIVFFENAE